MPAGTSAAGRPAAPQPSAAPVTLSSPPRSPQEGEPAPSRATPPQSAADRAYADVRERILTGDLPGGTLVSEGEVASELAMSRTPVREAFLRLQAEGWMQLFPKRGALVRPVQPGEIAEVIEARHLIESAAVRKAVTDPEVTRALSQTLTATLAAQHDAAVRDDLDAFTAADVAFHRAIVDTLDNSILVGVYASLRDRQQRMTSRSVRRHPGPVTEIHEQHAALAALVAAGDADGFSTTLLEHMLAVHAGLLR